MAQGAVSQGAVSAPFTPEHEYDMSINRVVIVTTLFAATILFGHAQEKVSFDYVTQIYLLYLCCAFAIFGHVCFMPDPHHFRRVFAMTLDLGALSYASAYIGPKFMGFLYPGYLLVIYGYGFRYGQNWLIASAAMSIVGVIAAIAVSPEWQADAMTSGGMLVGLIIMPTYALRLVRNLWQAKAQAEESNRAKSMFIAAVSHDLRTPLNAIIGLADILTTSKSGHEDGDMAGMIGEAGRVLLGQIDSILEFSRLEMGRAPMTVETVDLYDMLHDVRELLDVSAQAKGIDLTLTVEGRVPRRIMSSPRHIRDSLVNLVGNAIKFTADGSVDIRVRAVDVERADVRLRFEVRDTGIGISVQAQRHIFERFSQADGSIRDRFGGSGLGLAIARQLVHALRGEIGVVSAEGVGSTFWFEIAAGFAPVSAEQDVLPAHAIVFSDDQDIIETSRRACASVRVIRALPTPDLWREICGGDRLPLIVLDGALCVRQDASVFDLSPAERRGARAGMVVVSSEGTTNWPAGFARRAMLPRPVATRSLVDALFLVSGAGRASAPEIAPAACKVEMSVLVAEDNRTNQKVIAKMLQLAGRQVEVVGDGQAALDVLAQKRFDAVLMDINMPALDGVEATRRLRIFERNLGRRTPVVALTADVTAETRARCLAVGMDDCVTKPINLPALLKTLDRVTGIEAGAEASDFESAGARMEVVTPAETAAQEPSTTGLNPQALLDLERLGGPDFVREVAEQFVSDAALLLRSLATAAQEADVEKFRDDAHALRSCSANIGARSIYELCLSWRQMGAQEFAQSGVAYVERLEREFASARAELAPWLDRAA